MYDTFLGFDSTNPEDAALIASYHVRRRRDIEGLPTALIDHIKTTEVGMSFVIPITSHMVANTFYTAEDLAELFNRTKPRVVAEMSTRQIASKMTVLGRPEQRLGNGQTIFQRGNTTPQTYKVSQKMVRCFSV